MSDAGGKKFEVKVLNTYRKEREDEEVRVANQKAIEFLEGALERAKSEKAVFALVIMSTADECIVDGWSSEGRIRPYMLLGALTDVLIKFRDKNIEQR